jgi:hypothetical protein
MLTKEQAFNIANQIIPGLESKLIKLSDQLSNSQKYNSLPENCWYIVYYPVQVNYSSCVSSSAIYLCISKESGEVLYHNYI